MPEQPIFDDRSDEDSVQTNNVLAAIQNIEAKIDTTFAEIFRKLETMDARITAIEQNSNSQPSSSTPAHNSPDTKRKRRSPPELQVRMYV